MTATPARYALVIVARLMLAFLGLLIGAIGGLFIAGALGWLPNLC